MDRCRLSVIVPVFNAENFLDRCIKSLLSQTLDDYEIILVNDGSTDGSSEIIRGYAEKYARVIPVHQNNMGVSQARNKGIGLARGEYIAFADADDIVEPDMYEKLYSAARRNNCDVVIFNHKFEAGGRIFVSDYNLKKDEVLSREDMVEVMKLLLNSGFMCPVWNKLFKRSFITENNLLFEKGRNYGEDFLFNFHAFTKARRCIYTGCCGYLYTENANGLVRLGQKDFLKRDINYYLLCKGLIRKSSFEGKHLEEYENAAALRFVDSCIGALYQYIVLRKELKISERYKRITEIIRNQYVNEAAKRVKALGYPGKGRFDRYMLEMLGNRNVLGIVTGMLYTKYKSSIFAKKNNVVRLVYGK